MNYKAHVPAGITFAAGVSLIIGQPAVIPMLIGGAIGGALPDIDVDTGSAIEKMGSKSARAGSKLLSSIGLHKIGNLLVGLGAIFDHCVLRPLCKAWRFLADNVLTKAYMGIYNIPIKPRKRIVADKNGKSSEKSVSKLGELAGWDVSDPSVHRGGITHSLTFLVTSCIMTVPIALILQSFPFWLGCELGILSHLVTDSMCRSGVKYFWPWLPKIGFADIHGKNVGRGIRIMPASLLVKTGCDSWNNDYIENEFRDEKERREARTLRRREKMWQKIFQLLAVVLIVSLIALGGASWSFVDKANAVEAQQPQSAQTQNVTQQGNASSNNTGKNSNATDNTQNNASNGMAAVSTSDSISGETTPENAGPTSLTMGDLDISLLPRGIMKMPDESLWVVGVGPVNEQNLNNQKWSFTDDEKKKLLAASKAQRSSDIPTTLGNAANDLVSKASDLADLLSSSANSNTSSNNTSSGFLSSWFDDLGIDTSASGNYQGGFLGITPYTRS